MALGLVYFVFAPSIVTTPAAGRALPVRRRRDFPRRVCSSPLPGCRSCVLPSLPAVLAGLLVGVGTFFAQAVATGFRQPGGDDGPRLGERALSRLAISSAASSAASSSARSLILRWDRRGWTACVVAIGLSLAAAALLSLRLHVMPVRSPTAAPQ